MAIKGYYANPSQKECFMPCSACFRCDQRFKYAKCNGCSGHHDPFGVIDPHPDDWCNCTEGVLRAVTQEGKHILVRYQTNPFAGQVTMTNKTADEEAWDDYVRDLREKLDDPTWEPVKIVDHKDAGTFKYLGQNYGS